MITEECLPILLCTIVGNSVANDLMSNFSICHNVFKNLFKMRQILSASGKGLNIPVPKLDNVVMLKPKDRRLYF